MGSGLVLMSTGVSATGRIWARVEMGPQPSASDVPGDGRAVPFSQLLRSPSETSPPRLRCGDEVALLGRGLGAVAQDVGLTGEL